MIFVLISEQYRRGGAAPSGAVLLTGAGAGQAGYGGARGARMGVCGRDGAGAGDMPRLRLPRMIQPPRATRRRMARISAARAASSSACSWCRRAVRRAWRRRGERAAQVASRPASGVRLGVQGVPADLPSSSARIWLSRDRIRASSDSWRRAPACRAGAAGAPGRAQGPAGGEGCWVMGDYITNVSYRRKGGFAGFPAIVTFLHQPCHYVVHRMVLWRAGVTFRFGGPACG